MFKGKCPYMHVFVQVYVHLCIVHVYVHVLP